MTFAAPLHDPLGLLKKPWAWALVATLAVSDFLGTGSLLLPPPMPSRLAQALNLLLCVLLNASAVFFSPWPWLWGGRSGRGPCLVRGAVLATLAALLCSAPFLAIQVAAPRVALLRACTHAWAPPAFVVSSYVCLYGLMGFALVSLGREKEARQEAEAQAGEAMWILLRGHLNPHVFFNAMNHLTELIAKDPALAEQAVADLTDLYRRLLEYGQQPAAPLREERTLVERYLNIEALRLGPRMAATWAWDPALDAYLAPPLLLQPLVENAIKHGLSPHPAGGILRIEGWRADSVVRIRVANTGAPLGPRSRQGSGLDNLEARLRLLSDPRVRFSLGTGDGWTVAELTLPASTEAP